RLRAAGISDQAGLQGAHAYNLRFFNREIHLPPHISANLTVFSLPPVSCLKQSQKAKTRRSRAFSLPAKAPWRARAGRRSLPIKPFRSREREARRARRGAGNRGSP